MVAVRRTLLAGLLALSACSEPAAPAGEAPTATTLRQVDIPDQATHWSGGGYVELQPAVRYPTAADGGLRIRLFVQLPQGTTIGVVPAPGHTKELPKIPPGVTADRIEARRVVDAQGQESWSVVDVRGTTFREDGEWFHVYRAIDSRPGAALHGWEWRRDDEVAAKAATEQLMSWMRGRAQMSDGEGEAMVERVGRLNDCAGCHLHAKTASTRIQPKPRAGYFLPGGATDASGLYGIVQVLEDTRLIDYNRPHDANTGDRWFDASCGETPAESRTLPGGAHQWACPTGERPMGHKAIATALAEGDAHAASVCASRRVLWEHFDAAARQAYAEGFRACGLVGS